MKKFFQITGVVILMVIVILVVRGLTNTTTLREPSSPLETSGSSKGKHFLVLDRMNRVADSKDYCKYSYSGFDTKSSWAMFEGCFYDSIGKYIINDTLTFIGIDEIADFKATIYRLQQENQALQARVDTLLRAPKSKEIKRLVTPKDTTQRD